MKTEVLDLREDLRKGCAPFGRIMAAATGVQNGDTLVLIAPFEPLPLFKVMEQQGFTHAAVQTPGGDWEVRFTRVAGKSVEAPVDPPCGCSRHEAGKIVEVDARGLQPPQPLVMILEAVAGLSENAALRARTDRRPMHLYPELESRGFCSSTEEQADGSFITHIQRG